MTEAVSILQTGTIRIRPSQRTQSASRPVALRRLKVLLGGRSWTEPLPINTYLIDHPDGPILFDAGESPHVTDRGCSPGGNRSSTTPTASKTSKGRASW